MDSAVNDKEIGRFAARVLKVNHAGENGAVNIYAGQIAVARLTAPGMVAQLSEFKSHEERHRAVFWAELARRQQRHCRSYWLCGIGGYSLGLITAIFGGKAIAATTVAVERVVLRHLEQQLAVLTGKDHAAAAAIASIVTEERQHMTSRPPKFPLTVSGPASCCPWSRHRRKRLSGSACECGSGQC